MKKVLALILSMFMMLMAGCGETEKNSSNGSTVEPAAPKTETSAQEKNSSAEKKSDGKILVLYYSRTGDNFEVGVIEKGNTHIVADMIAEKVGADMFEIKPVKPYPESYQECTEVAKKEIAENARPEYVGKVENFEQYDTIFLGYPIWWSDLPPVVYTFLESNNFNGKTIIPFCTSGGEYMTGKESEIPQFAKGATVREGIGIRGKNCQDNPESVREKVNSWLNGLGY